MFPPSDGVGGGKQGRRQQCSGLAPISMVCLRPGGLGGAVPWGWETWGCLSAPCGCPGGCVAFSASIWHHKWSQESCWCAPNKHPGSAAGWEWGCWCGEGLWDGFLPWIRGCKCKTSPWSPGPCFSFPSVLCERAVPCDELPSCSRAGCYCWVPSWAQRSVFPSALPQLLLKL